MRFNPADFIGKILNKPTVIIEIGNDWLKIIQAKVSSVDGVSIDKVNIFKLVEIKDSVSTVISNAFRELKLNKEKVTLCLPRHLVTTRILELPSVNPQEIADIINLQIGKQTPYSKEEIISAYKIIDSLREGYTKVILVIVRRNIVSERLDTLSKSGINVDKIALSSEGVFFWFNALYLSDNKTAANSDIILVDIDSNYSDFLVISKGKLIFTKNILIGANSLLDDKDPKINNFIEELEHARDMYLEESHALKPGKLYLSGAVKYINDLAANLSARMDLPAEVIDPLKNNLIKDPFILKNTNFKFVSFAPLIGIALKNKELNLLLMPNEMRIAKLMEAKRSNLTMMGALFAAVIMVISLMILINIYNKNNYIKQLKSRTGQIKEDSDLVDKMRRSINLLQDRLDAKGDTLSVLDSLHKILPKEIYLTNVNIERKKDVTIKGRANAMSDVFKFVSTLENSPLFKNVKNTYTTTKKENNQEFADFEITASYEAPD